MSRRNWDRIRSANYMDVIYLPAEGLVFEENAKGFIVLDMENTGFYNSIAQRFFHRPRISHISLDTYGTTLWKLLDGQRDVFSVVLAMKQAFPDEGDQMLNRCIQFLNTLETNHFIVRKE